MTTTPQKPGDGRTGGCRFWLHGFPVPGRTEALAADAEELGYDGLLLADSQSLVGDVFVELALAARATTSLGLGTGVTNPLTRHPAVTAGAAATLQLESGGRAVLGVGRGDSALARVGLPQPSTPQLVDFVRRVRAYLRGEARDAGAGRPADRLEWLTDAALPAVPVELAATGPATIAAGAVNADRVMFTVGADPARLADGIALARAAREQAGIRGDAGVGGLGAYVNIACHPDAEVARDLVRGSAAIFARFSAGTAPVQAYDGATHGLRTAAQAGQLGADFLDRFTIAGPAEHCLDRLARLTALGLDRIVLVPGSRDADPGLLAASHRAVALDVLPALRAAAG